jgi:hypothetical protein
LPAVTTPPHLQGQLELRLTAQNIRDLLAGKSIQVAEIGGVGLKMSLHADVDKTALVGILEEASKTMPTLP